MRHVFPFQKLFKLNIIFKTNPLKDSTYKIYEILSNFMINKQRDNRIESYTEIIFVVDDSSWKNLWEERHS